MGHAPTRLLVAGLAAALVLAILATAAAAAQGGSAPAAPPAAVPPLARVPAPQPMPANVVTPLPEPTPPAPKKKVRVNRATTTTSPTSTTTTLATPPPPAPPPVIPQGKGMWIWKPELAEHGNVPALIARSKAVGLTHLFVRTGSTWDGLQNLPYLDQLIPAAHAAGMKVYGWDFPKLEAPPDDVARAMAALNHVVPGGEHLDGFAPDIETPTEGTQFTPAGAQAYATGLRAAAGPSTLLVAVVPNPTPQMVQKYSYDAVVPVFDAIAPMVYWLNREPDTDVATALDRLAPLGKPVMPIGQAYDGGLEGGPPGTPTGDEISAFINAAQAHGAAGVSFWSWQHASDEMWNAIAAGQEVGQH